MERFLHVCRVVVPVAGRLKIGEYLPRGKQISCISTIGNNVATIVLSLLGASHSVA